MTGPDQDTRVEAVPASAEATVVVPTTVALVLRPVSVIPLPDVQTPVRTVVSVGGSSISSVSPPHTGLRVGKGAVADVAAPFCVREVA